MKKSKPTILVADDDAQIREALAIRLTQSGFDVVMAANGDEAIRLVEKTRLDAAVLDVQMPGADGFAVCEHMRRSNQKLPIFLLTGSSDGIIRNHLGVLTETVGGDRCLTKPYDGKALALILRNALDAAPSD